MRQYFLAIALLGVVLLAPSTGWGHDVEVREIPTMDFGDRERQDGWTVRVIVDTETGCQYLWVASQASAYGFTGGLAPRNDEDGTQMGCRNLERDD